MFSRKDFIPLCNVGVKDQWGYRPNPKPGQGYGMTIHRMYSEIGCYIFVLAAVYIKMSSNFDFINLYLSGMFLTLLSFECLKVFCRIMA